MQRGNNKTFTTFQQLPFSTNRFVSQEQYTQTGYSYSSHRAVSILEIERWACTLWSADMATEQILRLTKEKTAARKNYVKKKLSIAFSPDDTSFHDYVCAHKALIIWGVRAFSEGVQTMQDNRAMNYDSMRSKQSNQMWRR